MYDVKTKSIFPALTSVTQLFHLLFLLLTRAQHLLRGLLWNTTAVFKSSFTHAAGLHIKMRAHTPENKPIEAILALHTPRPTAHTECLWEHLWCERWRMKSSGWVWFFLSTSPLPLPQTRRPGSFTHSLPPSPSSVIFSRTMNIPPTLPSEVLTEVASLVLDV